MKGLLLVVFASTLTLAVAVHAQETLPDQQNPPGDEEIEQAYP